MNLIKDTQEYLNTIALGDIHGDFHVLTYFINKNQLLNTAYFQVGDFGIGFNFKSEVADLKILNETLIKYNSKLYVIRGNHDNPSYFDGKHDLSNIKFVPDYTILEINNSKVLMIGGALSIDRKIRTQGIDYWEKEALIKPRESYYKYMKEISTVITHTTPDFIEPLFLSQLVLNFCVRDSSLKQELINERVLMSEIIEKIISQNKETLKLVLFGHFHFSKTSFYKDVKFKLLNVNEFFENVI